MRGGVNMASIKDVAQKAGVGVGTVSRVLNNSGYVSDETREKIEEAMKNLQYTPNELARNLYRKKSGIIAVLVPTVEIPFFAELVHNIEAELYNEGFKIMLGNTDKAHNAELEYLDMLNRHIVDGVITGVHSLDVEEYKKIKKPIVAFESLTYKGKEYALHQDIEDEDQTTLIPKVSTTASDKTNGTHMSYAGKKVTLVDTVKVENIVEGRE